MLVEVNERVYDVMTIDVYDDEKGRSLKDFLRFYLQEFCIEALPKEAKGKDVTKCIMDNIEEIEEAIASDLKMLQRL